MTVLVGGGIMDEIFKEVKVTNSSHLLGLNPKAILSFEEGDEEIFMDVWTRLKARTGKVLFLNRSGVWMDLSDIIFKEEITSFVKALSKQ